MILWPLHFERSSVDHLSYQATLCLGLEIWQVVPRPLSRAHRAHKVHKIHTVLHRAHLGHTRDTEQTRHTGHQKTQGAPCTGHPVSQAANLASCGQAIFQHGWALLLSSQFGLNWGTIGLLSDSGHPALSTGNLYPGWKLSLSLSLTLICYI